jgi:serine/threonine-protein kinase RsbT
MPVLKHDTLPARSENDVVLVRQAVRKWAVELGFSLVDLTKIVTAASELARNTLIHGGGGTVRLEAIAEGTRKGLRLTFEDQGPGIPDIELALRDGYTTGNGLGLGLSGSKRLMSDFQLVSKVGEGTRITVTRWK